jgi:DnaJ-class molecular chaperone
MYLEEQQNKDHIQMEKLKSNSPELCDVCHGSGATGDGLCSSCNGKGII